MKTNIKNVEISLAVLISLLYIYSRESWSFIIPDVLWGLLLVALIFFSILSVSRNLKINLKINLFIICLFFMILIIVFGKNYDLEANYFGFITSYILPIICGMILYVTCGKNKTWVNLFLSIVCLFSFLYSLITIVCFFNNNVYYKIIVPLLSKNYNLVSSKIHPSAGFNVNYGQNSLYIFSGLSVVFCLAYILRVNHKVSLKLWILSLFFILTLIINAKRSTFLAFIISLTVIYLVYENRNAKYFKIILIVLMILIITLGINYFIPDSFTLITRISSFLKDGDSQYSDNRYEVWGYAFKRLLESPFFGKGWRWFKYNVVQFGDDKDVHNTFLQLLLEEGGIGAIPFFIFIFGNYWKSLNISKSIKKYSNISLKTQYLSVLTLFFQSFSIIYMLFTTCFYNPSFMVLYYIFCSLNIYCERYLQNHSNKE